MINWKLRFKNKTTLTAIIGCSLAFIYQMLGIFGVTPTISENELGQAFGVGLNILLGVGIITDPTTKGISDSARALDYKELR